MGRKCSDLAIPWFLSANELFNSHHLFTGKCVRFVRRSQILSSIWDVNDKQIWASRRDCLECTLNIVNFKVLFLNRCRIFDLEIERYFLSKHCCQRIK